MKKVFIILAIIVVLIVGAIIAAIAIGVANIDGLVKSGVERGGTWATGAPTTVEGVDIGLMAGTVNMDGFKIGNPPGFDTPHFLALGNTDVQLNTDTISKDLIQVTSMNFSEINVYLDKGGDPSNYNTILESLKRFESGESAAPADDAQTGGTKVAIDSLVLENIEVHVANMPGVSLLAGDVAVTIPRVELKNIGKDKPMNAGEVINLVVKTVLSAAVNAGGGIIPGDVLGDLTSGLSGLTNLSDLGIDAIGGIGDLGGAIGDQAEQVLGDLAEEGNEIVEDAVDDVKNELEKGINNIFGNKKDDDD